MILDKPNIYEEVFMAEELNIYQKLAKIRKQVEVIQKNKSGYGYKYVSEDEILAKISVFMDKYGLSLIPSIVGGTMGVEPYTYKKTKSTSKGDIYEEINNEVLVGADMVWTWAVSYTHLDVYKRQLL